MRKVLELFDVLVGDASRLTRIGGALTSGVKSGGEERVALFAGWALS